MAYIGGHITRTLHNKICNDCSKFLTADATSAEYSRTSEQYDSVLKGKGLIRPSKNLVDLLRSIEAIYNSNIDQCTYPYSGNLKRETELAHARAQSSLCLSPSNECCDLGQKAIVKFL